MTKEQASAIEAAQKHWGRCWKSKLRQSWMNGKYPASLKEHVPHLQQLRNQGYRFNK